MYRLEIKYKGKKDSKDIPSNFRPHDVNGISAQILKLNILTKYFFIAKMQIWRLHNSLMIMFITWESEPYTNRHYTHTYTYFPSCMIAELPVQVIPAVCS